ncbi:MAG: Asr1405/Asl0597 family protein [Cyanobacteria bacterium J06627_8]
MNEDKLDDLSNGWVETQHVSPWEIYTRLKELDIPCHRQPYEPLKIHVHSPLAIVQAWSVCRQFTQSRVELVDWLNSCWLCPLQSSHSSLEH